MLYDLLTSGDKRHFEKGRLVQTSEEENQQLYFITSGYVKRYTINDNGTARIQNIHGPGDLFPLTLALNSLLSQPIYRGLAVYYYEIMRDTEAYTVDIPYFIQSIKAEPVLYHDVLEMTASRLRESMYRFENQTLSSGYRQIAHYLLFYARRFGIDDEHGTRIGISFTHQDIADVVMLTRETVTRELKNLRDKGLIIANEEIVIPDMDKLEQEAYS